MSGEEFHKEIWRYYWKYRRNFPWRNTRNPYRILISEIMLQQTQAERVIPKYNEFLKVFPTLSSLAGSPLLKVLRIWKGLGYNRRALYLKKTAQIILEEHNGVIPRKKEELLALPGIGEATAGDILAFAWDIPATVIETNIRSVFIHFFFRHKKKVSDKEIAVMVEKTLPKKRIREWYYALMDYGAYLKEKENPSRKSTHYKKQSQFKGSNRELRSFLLEFILENSPAKETLVKKTFSRYPIAQVKANLDTMGREGLISKAKGLIKISG